MELPLIIFPFGSAGDLSPIPSGTQPDGSVSYQQGYGIDYQRDQATDPLAKDIDRRQMNQLFNTLTTFMRAWQLTGSPEWASPADNAGNAITYDAGTVVRWRASSADEFRNYISLANFNLSAPSDTTKWREFVPVLRTIDNNFTVPQTIPPGVGAQAMQAQQAIGRLINIQVFYVPGNHTYSATPGTTSIIVDTVGAGGGGGGCSATASGQVSASGGGGGGGFSRNWVTSAFNGATVVVGTGGAGGVGGASPTNGVSGTASAFSGFISAGGGGGGILGGPFSSMATSFELGVPANPGVAVAGGVLTLAGGWGRESLVYRLCRGGDGGGTYYGPGALGALPNAGGRNGANPGAGGSGAAAANATPGYGGGNGANGQVTIYEYA